MYNYHAPYCQVLIQTRDKKEWVFDVAKYPFITSVAVTLNLGGTEDGMTLGVEAPYDEGLAMIEAGIFDFMNLVKVRMGYLAANDLSASSTPWMFGFLGEAATGLNLTPEGLSGSVQAKFEQVKEFMTLSEAQYGSGNTLQQVIAYRAEAMGYALMPMGNAAKVLGDVSSFLQHDKKKIKFYGADIRAGHMDVLRAAMELAGLEFYIGGTDVAEPMEEPKIRPTIFYFPKDYTSNKQQPERIYAMRGVFNPTASPPVFPITGMSYSGGAAMFRGNARVSEGKPMAGGGGIKTTYVDMETGEIVTIVKEPKDVPRGGVKDGATTFTEPADVKIDGVKAITAKDNKKTHGAKLSIPNHGGDAAKANAEQKAVNEIDRQGDPFAIVLTVETIGSPLERPGEPVYVELAGSMRAANGGQSPWGGPYQVKKVTHNYAAGDFKTTLIMQRWGTKNASNVDKKAAGAPDLPEAK